MKIYKYDNVTGEFLSEGTARPDPKNKSSFLIPANATTKEPISAKRNKAVVYKNGAWTYVVDCRGETYWTDWQTSETIKELGVKPPKGSFSERPNKPKELQVLHANSTIDQKHADALSALTGDHSIEERDTWVVKQTAAQAFKEGNATLTQQGMLDAEATERGMTLEELADLILARADQYMQIIGVAAAARQKARAAVLVAKDELSIDDMPGAVANALAALDQTIDGLKSQLQN